MRIAYMLTSLGIGGAERQVVALAERMAARGHTVALLVLRPRVPSEWPTSVDVVRLDMRKTSVSIFGGLLRARRFFREFRPDLVHSHTFPANMAARMLRLIGATPAVLSTIHNIYEGGWSRTLAYRLTDGLSTHSTAVSEAVALRQIHSGAVPQRKCSVVTNGIDIAEFSPSRDNGARLRDLMFAKDDFIWLAAGRIVPGKDYNNLLAAFRQVRASFPQTQLWIAGEPAEFWTSRIDGVIVGRELDGADNVRWLGPRDDMPSLLNAADVFVLSSAWEGMPLVVGEAMAMEKPVVATDVGGVRELVGDTGTLVPAKDSDALAAAMLAVMLSSPVSRQTMGRAARARIVESFSMDSKVDAWESMYSSLLGQRL